MKKLILKSLFVSLSLLFASQISAQENELTNVEGPTEASCDPFPKCIDDAVTTDTVNREEESQWSLLWDKLTKEMKEAVSSMPAPTQPE